MNNIDNFRDLGRIETQDGRRIAYNKIFRSRQLIDVKNEPLLEFIARFNIKSVIDFRTIDEMDKYGWYSNSIKENINYYNIPLQCEGITVDQKLKMDRGYDGYEYLYFHLLKNERERIKQSFEILLNPNNYPIVIHCIAGKDRTGIFISLLLMTLNVKKAVIKNDYLLTENSQEKNFIHLCNLIEEMGGINGYLKLIGIDRFSINKLKKILLE